MLVLGLAYRAVLSLRLVRPFVGIVHKHIRKRLIWTLKYSYNFPELKIINSHRQL